MMNITQKKTSYTALYIAMILILISLSFLLLSVLGIMKNTKIKLTNDKEKTTEINEIVFSEDQWRKQLEPYLKFKEEQDIKESLQQDQHVPPDNNVNFSDKQLDKNDSKDKEPPRVATIIHEAYFTSSLTSAPGSVALSGKTTGYQMEINGKNQVLTEGKFSTGVASQFKIKFYNSEISRSVHVSSPPYSTNVVVQYLTIGVDPFNQHMSLHGKISLNLPGTMEGELLNLSTGAGSSTVLENGAFSLSVPLTMGENYITARGSWLTISLDLPSIKITLSD